MVQFIGEERKTADNSDTSREVAFADHCRQILLLEFGPLCPGKRTKIIYTSISEYFALGSSIPLPNESAKIHI